MRTNVLLPLLVVVAFASGVSAQQACTAGPAAPALDHVVLVVRNVDSAAAAFHRSGFTIKAGRLHSNNLLNKHIKFRDSTSIELMTVRGRATDSIAQDYAALLAGGEGGVYVALHTASLTLPQRFAGAGRLDTRRSASTPFQFLGFPPGSDASSIFFMTGPRGANDPDSLLTHSPAASGLTEAWVEGGDRLGRLLGQVGATLCGAVKAPDGTTGMRWALRNGSLVVVPVRSVTRPRVLGVVIHSDSAQAQTVRPIRNFWIQYRK